MTNASISRAFFLAALGLVAWPAARAADATVLTRGAVIEIPDAPGKFDFLEVDAARHRLLASHEKDETADFIDLNARQLITRVKLGPVVDTVVDPQTGNYYCSVQDDKRIAVLDGASLKEIASIALDGECDGIVLDAKSRRLYVTHDNGTHLWTIDVDARKVVATVEIPGSPECLALDTAAGKLYLNIKTKDEVVVIDTIANKLIAHWPVAPAVAPHGLVFDAAAGRLYSAGDNGVLAVLDVKSGRVIGSAKITAHVDQAAIDLASHTIYCAGAGWLSVVRATAAGAELIGNVPTAETAKNVAVDPQTHVVWTTFTDGKKSYAQSFVRP